MAFGITATWVQIRAQLPVNCVTLRKLLTTLSLSSLICELGPGIVWITDHIHWLCGLNENALGGHHEAWREVLRKWQHFKTKSVITLVHHQLGETNSEPFILALYSQTERS